MRLTLADVLHFQWVHRDRFIFTELLARGGKAHA
jgi:hypothetical protein